MPCHSYKMRKRKNQYFKILSTDKKLKESQYIQNSHHLKARTRQKRMIIDHKNKKYQ